MNRPPLQTLQEENSRLGEILGEMGVTGQMGAGAAVAHTLLLQMIADAMLKDMDTVSRRKFKMAYQTRLCEQLSSLVGQAEASRTTLPPELTSVPTDG